jgi:hypothetical protein
MNTEEKRKLYTFLVIVMTTEENFDEDSIVEPINNAIASDERTVQVSKVPNMSPNAPFID